MGDRTLASANHLIVFTRYPQPGTAKTRLIPELGAAGAAQVSRQLTEHTLTQVSRLCEQAAIAVTIAFAGGDVFQMQQWLGAHWQYVPQTGADLGDRMATAMRVAFAEESQRVVIIGTDCPALTPALLSQAFQTLKQTDLVLGPAVDGGYYLIGIRQFDPAIVAGIAWSTDLVLSQTLAIAASLGWTTHLLPTLQDVDHPADLAVWHAIASPINRAMSGCNDL